MSGHASHAAGVACLACARLEMSREALPEQLSLLDWDKRRAEDEEAIGPFTPEEIERLTPEERLYAARLIGTFLIAQGPTRLAHWSEQHLDDDEVLGCVADFVGLPAAEVAPCCRRPAASEDE